MRQEIEITPNVTLRPKRSPVSTADVDTLTAELERDGVVVLPHLLSASTLQSMQQAFRARLQNVRWNNFDGYQETEPYRHMVQDVLTLDQGFVDLVLHPLVKAILNRYLKNDFELTEAKGWRSLPTNRDFHGWHGDAWYDQSLTQRIEREVKLAIYLSDVRSGAFNYIKGSHRKQHPRLVKNSEVSDVPSAQIAELMGAAGTAFLFDTSGIHRQGVPMLEEREACFFNYHDPKVRVQKEDLDTYRYHPLILNAAFLGNLSDEDQRILGFGNKVRFNAAFTQPGAPSLLYRTFQSAHTAQLHLKDLRGRVNARIRRLVG